MLYFLKTPLHRRHSPFLPLRLGEILAFLILFHVSMCCKQKSSSITVLVCTQSRAGFPSWYRLSLTSLPAQNRLQSVNTSISEKSDLGFPLLIGGFVRFTGHATQRFRIWPIVHFPAIAGILSESISRSSFLTTLQLYNTIYSL